jgi:hypothetical protein
MRRAAVLALVLALVPAARAAATPVAKNEAEREQLGRVFPEPMRSTDFINHGPRNGPSEIADGLSLLNKVYPGYVEFSTIDRELNDPNAFSLGPDRKAPWEAGDTKDGLPFYVAKITDESVPDRDKAYVLLVSAHPAEPCGQEGNPRFLEDLLIWRDKDPGHVLDDGTGLYGKPHRMTVAELLRKVKIYWVSTSPDGWFKGEGPANDSDNYNYGGFNENRVAYQDGWVYPKDEALSAAGYAVLTQPEGAVVSRYLRHVRQDEMGGRPFAVANDQHGPVPTSGAIILHDQGNDPAKLDRTQDYAQRVKDNMDEVFARYFTGTGLTVTQQAASQAGDVRDLLFHKYTEATQQPITEKAAYLTLQWAEYATAWDHLDYTVAGSWGGWAGSRAGLGADSLSFETDCEAVSGRWNPALFQLFSDNVRAADETATVIAAQRAGSPTGLTATTYDLHGRVGFVETGARVTDRDGNPSPPPAGYPGTPEAPQIQQTPYDVSDTDYFRDLRRVVRSPIDEVPAAAAGDHTRGLDTLVVADTADVDAAALRRFADAGGNVVLTDSALRLAPKLFDDIPAGAVKEGFSYVGYGDLDRSHAWTQGLYKRARQMYDPVGLGYPLLMERDQYWPCDGTCEVSPTQNSSPLWTVDRASWEHSHGVTVATADPPADRKFGGEGTKTDKTEIGLRPLGKGRVVLFGALLPQPTEAYPHWFGLDGYTVSVPAQQILLRALAWNDGRAKPLGGAPRRTCASRRRFVIRLPRRVRGHRVVRGSVRVDGRRVKVQRVHGRLVALVDLRGKKRGAYRVTVTATGRGAKRRTSVRRFRTCTRRAR